MGKSSGPAGRSVTRHLRRVSGWLVLMVILGYGASNVWLSSRWCTGVAEARLKARTGMDWQVESMIWSPWSGITIDGAQMLQPEELREHLNEPVISVDHIRVKPYWAQLLRGRARAREVTMDSPRLTVTVEMLAAMASNVSSRQAVPPVVVPPQKPLPPGEEKPVPVPPKKPQPDGSEKKPGKPSPPVSPAKRKLPPADLPLRLRVDGASFRLVSSIKNMEFIRLDGASLDMPVFGEDAKGLIKVEALKIPGFPELTDLAQAVVWKRPYLQIEEQTVDVGGLKLRFLGQLGMARKTQGKLPFYCALAIDPQKLGRVKWLERLALEVQAKELAGKFSLGGSLSNPMSWRAEMLLLGKDVEVKEEHGSHDVVFEEVALPAVFRQGQLRWSGARMIGEDISVLGNGQVSVRDGILSVTRLVASPEVAKMLSRGLNGAGLIRAGGRWWSDLDTPDRKMRDLVVSGSLADPMVDAGKKNVDLPVAQVVMTTLKFIREEMKEEGKNLAPVPNKELLNGVTHENH
jgi:hypothetical protein